MSNYPQHSLADVMPSLLASLDDLPNTLNLPGASGVGILLVDGMGLQNILAHRAYARFIVPKICAALDAGFPSSTVNGIATVTTGCTSAKTGMVGYVSKVPETGAPVNLLKGLGGDVDPMAWQQQPTMFELAAQQNRSAVVIGQPKFSHSGLTQAALRGARYRNAFSIEDVMDAMIAELDDGTELVYGYVPFLDQIGHRYGPNDVRWTEQLESLDGRLKRAATELRKRKHLYVTADHGMVQIDQDSLVDAEWLLDEPGVQFVGGEPRCLQIYCSEPESLLAKLHSRYAGVCNVYSRAQIIADGWFGSTPTEAITARIGELIVTPKSETSAMSVSKLGEADTNQMLGQHGGRSNTERLVPLIQVR